MKTIIITGISSGLGFELSKLFLDNGFRVIGLSKKMPNEFKKYNEDEFIFIKTNLNCNKSIHRSLETLNNLNEIYNISKIDYLFLNAGVWDFEIIEDLNFKKVDEIIKTNLSANIKIISGLFNRIIKNGIKIFVSGSVNWSKPEINQISYNISKGALKSFTDSLKIELEEYNLENNVVYLELDDFNSNLVKINSNQNDFKYKNIPNSNEVAREIYSKFF